MPNRMPDVHGLLLLDKPQGYSSAQALAQVKRALGVSSAGHTGTLDPLATGMLPLVLGDATRLSSWMLSAHKAYRVKAQLGVCTDTLDAEGKVTANAPVDAGWLQRLELALAGLRGTIWQTPPQYSALKRDGKPAYQLARAGQVVELAARQVEVQRLVALDHGVDWVELEVHCSKGTYVRSLVDDLGRALGFGAHVSALRRLWVAPFVDAPMWTLEAIRADPLAAADAVLPALAMIPQLPRVLAEEACIARLRNGQRIAGMGGLAPVGEVAVVDAGAGLVAVAELDQFGVLRPHRVFTPSI
jgi:tRNA pseudouridine55 synthase